MRFHLQNFSGEYTKLSGRLGVRLQREARLVPAQCTAAKPSSRHSTPCFQQFTTKRACGVGRTNWLNHTRICTRGEEFSHPVASFFALCLRCRPSRHPSPGGRSRHRTAQLRFQDSLLGSLRLPIPAKERLKAHPSSRCGAFNIRLCWSLSPCKRVLSSEPSCAS
jgi:hypothetical protein